MNYLMRISNPYIYMCRIANPTQRPALRTSPRTDILLTSPAEVFFLVEVFGVVLAE